MARGLLIVHQTSTQLRVISTKEFGRALDMFTKRVEFISPLPMELYRQIRKGNRVLYRLVKRYPKERN